MFGNKKRTFRAIQLIILRKLRTKQRTIYQVAKETKLHFRTVRNQLIILRGKGYVELIFELNHIKVYSIAKEGHKYLKKLER